MVGWEKLDFLLGGWYPTPTLSLSRHPESWEDASWPFLTSPQKSYSITRVVLNWVKQSQAVTPSWRRVKEFESMGSLVL